MRMVCAHTLRNSLCFVASDGIVKQRVIRNELLGVVVVFAMGGAITAVSNFRAKVAGSDRVMVSGCKM